MRHALTATVATVAVGLCAAGTRAQNYIGDLNREFESVPTSQRSDEVLLPVLGEVEAPPEEVDSLHQAMLLIAGMPGWEAAEAWATAEPQQAAIEALSRATAERDQFSRAMVFAQPYGTSGVSPDLVRQGLYTELGDPPLLAAADFRYLEAMDRLQLLANVEASRLLSEGKPYEAASTMLDLFYLGRQIADRPLAREMEYGLEMSIEAIRRVRDLLYLDFQDGISLEPGQILDLAEDMEPSTGALDVGRLRFARGEREAAMQLVETVYRDRSGVDDRTFAATMSRLGSVDRPLRLFSEAAKWQAVQEHQADWYDARDELERIYSGWASRWRLDPFDPLLDLPFPYDLSDPLRYATVRSALGDLSDLFMLRKVLLTEVAGTQTALGVLGYRRFFGVYPPLITAIRPQWVNNIEPDPFNAGRDFGARPAMQFFVPVRDAYVASERDRARPVTVRFNPERTEAFERDFDEEDFLLYSVGANGVKDFAASVTQDPEATEGDYIIWPPMLSMERRYLLETDQFVSGGAN